MIFNYHQQFKGRFLKLAICCTLMLGTKESEVRCETCVCDFKVDFKHWNCKLQTITRKVGRWKISDML